MTSELFSGFVGLFMPFVVEVIKAKLPKTEGKWLGFCLALGVSVVIGGASSYIETGFDMENILASVGAALIASQGVYNFYFKGSTSERAIARWF